MHIVLLLVVVLTILVGPSIWVRSVLRKYSQPADRYSGTGGELARHLLDNLGLSDVAVETTEAGDHYDPADCAVRLTPDKHDGRSLTAITVAAHEVGHAMQDRDRFAPLRWRTRLVGVAAAGEKVGAGMLMVAPVAGLLTRAPITALLFAGGGLLSLASVAAVHLVTLPTEFDASFTRALPILEGGDYLQPGDAPHARKILTAAALTYVAAALMSLLNVGRWLAILRR
ncbi:MAG: zinc metallopeptidase [Gammaproteobacteria bacterium]|nr:zinc metallopeptidase [Gammaproteobacteria bacterium]NNF61345.1 zinc metallopeptidase [Gammaproteobacteria bacterium]